MRGCLHVGWFEGMKGGGRASEWVSLMSEEIE